MQGAALGLVLLGLLAVCQPKVCDAQFFYPQQNAGIRRVPPRGSVSRANSNAFQREVDFGPVEFTEGVSNSRQVTKSNGGARNGGFTSASRSNAISRGANIGGLDVGSTLTRSQTRTNGAVSRGVAYDVNVGNVGLGASLNPTNLQNGLGLHRDPNGGVSLGLGLLNLDLTGNANQNNQPLTQAQVNAQGQNARVRANSGSNTQMEQYGNIGVTTTQSHSGAVGRTRFGQTSANTGGATNNLATNAGGQGGPGGPFGIPFFGAPFRRYRRESYAPVNRYYNAPFSGSRQATQEHRYPIHSQHSTLNRPVFISQQNKSSSELEQEDIAELIDLQRSRDYSSMPPKDEGNVMLTVVNNPATAVEQFVAINRTRRQARTFDLIGDFINSLIPCVTPCTLEAYQQNRCCVMVEQPTPCCNQQPYPPPYPPQQRPPFPPFYPQPAFRPPIYLPPINCCIICINFGLFGPAPCTRYGAGGLYGGGLGTGTSLLGLGTNTLANGISTATNIGTNILGNTGQTLSVFLPPTIYG